MSDAPFDILVWEIVLEVAESPAEGRRLFERLRLTEGYARAHAEFVNQNIDGAIDLLRNGVKAM